MNVKERRNFWYALATLVGTVVGAGVFGLPYVFSRAGFSIGLVFLLIFGVVAILVHLMYGEVVLRTQGKHRFVGFVATYFGRNWRRVSTPLVMLELYGSLLAYIILGGKFTRILFGRGDMSEAIFSLSFFAVGSLLIFFGIRSVSLSEFVMSFFLVGIIALLFILGIPHLDLKDFQGIDEKNIFLPYGVILFALAGGAAIPELPDILRGNKRALKRVIIYGTLIPVLLYVVFVTSVIGISGEGVSEEAIEGLVPHLGNAAVFLGALFGLFAVFTSFLVLGINLRDTFLYDYKKPRFVAWLLALVPPMVLFMAGVNQFIGVIGFVGAIAGGITGIFIILLHMKVQREGTRSPEYSIRLPRAVSYGIVLVFSLGILWQLVTLLSG